MLVREAEGVVEVILGERVIVSSQIFRRVARSSMVVWVDSGVEFVGCVDGNRQQLGT